MSSIYHILFLLFLPQSFSIAYLIGLVVVGNILCWISFSLSCRFSVLFVLSRISFCLHCAYIEVHWVLSIFFINKIPTNKCIKQNYSWWNFSCFRLLSRPFLSPSSCSSKVYPVLNFDLWFLSRWISVQSLWFTMQHHPSLLKWFFEPHYNLLS